MSQLTKDRLLGFLCAKLISAAEYY